MAVSKAITFGYPGITTPVAHTSGKLVQRANFFAAKDSDGMWKYFSIKVDLDQVNDKNCKIIEVEKYKGPLGDGVVILRNGTCFTVTRKDLSRMRLLRINETTLKKLIANDTDTTDTVESIEADLGRVIGPRYDEGAARQIIQDQVQAVHGISNTEAPWRV